MEWWSALSCENRRFKNGINCCYTVLTNNSRSVVKIKTLSSHVIYDRFKTPFGGLIEDPINSLLKLDRVKKIKKEKI